MGQRIDRSTFIAGFAALALGLLAGPCPARAGEIFQFFTGTRQLGMGGAYVGVVDDETALVTNPAGVGKVREFTLNLFNPQVGGSVADTNLINLGNYNQATDVQGLLALLNQAKGTAVDGRASIFPSVVMPNFGVGALYNTRYDALVNPATNVYTFNYLSDLSGAMAFSVRFLGGVVKLGFNGRFIDRTEVVLSAPATATGLSLGSLRREGTGIASDVGLILSAPIVWLPAISAVAHDVGGTSYGGRAIAGAATTFRPADTPTTIDAAFSVFPILGRRAHMALTFEAHDLLTIGQEVDLMRRAHVGAEIGFADFFFVRGGMNQRYWTAGLEFATRFFQLQAASYGEEIGTPSATIEDRRWVGAMAIRF